MKLAHSLIMMTFALGVAVVAQASDPVARNEAPKYGDPGYTTIWDATPPDDRDDLPRQSRDAAARGWELMLDGDPTTAMKRFNQAWSLHPSNPRALWGMAIAQFERFKQDVDEQPGAEDLARLDTAVHLIEEAIALPDPEASMLNDGALLVMTRGALRQFFDDADFGDDFDAAEAFLDRAEREELHPMIYDNRAALSRYRGDERSAKKYEKRARQLRRERVGG